MLRNLLLDDRAVISRNPLQNGKSIRGIAASCDVTAVETMPVLLSHSVRPKAVEETRGVDKLISACSVDRAGPHEGLLGDTADDSTYSTGNLALFLPTYAL
jgi:hypothetical protein